MFSILLFYLLISITCLWTGYLCCWVLYKLVPGSGGKKTEKNGAVLAIWGLVAISSAGQIAELFIPVNPLAWLVWVLLLCLGAWWNKKAFFLFTGRLRHSYRRNKHLLIPAGIVLLLISILGAGPLMMDDTESYHMQCIKWIQEWGTVPGLANLHERFGFNSGWFAFAAFFIPQQATHNYYTVANGVLSVWIGLYLISQAFPGRCKEKASAPLPLACLLVLLMAWLCWPMIRGNATTANYDFVTTCLILVGFAEFIKSAERGQHWQAWLPEMILWPVFLFTIRIINFPLLLFSLFGIIYLIRRRFNGLLATCLLLSAALVTAFLARNVLLSGYPFFPAYQVDPFPVDWKADPDLTKQLVDYIKYFNRVNNAFLPIRETAKLALPDWLPLWFRSLSATDKLVLLGGLTGYGSWVVRQKAVGRPVAAMTFFAGVMVVQLVSWFLIAPDPRFVYGFLLMGIYLLCDAPYALRLQMYYSRWQKPLLAVLTTGLMAYLVAKVAVNPDYRHVLLPIRIPQPATHSLVVDGIRMHIPEKWGKNWNARCYATGLPCLYKPHPRLRARGKGMGDGFKLQR